MGRYARAMKEVTAAMTQVPSGGAEQADPEQADTLGMTWQEFTEDAPAGQGDTVGRVLGTADATPLQFWVAVRRRARTCSSTTWW